MVRANIKEASRLEKKTHVPDADRTSDRDAAAECIQAVLDDADWQDTTITAIADECGYSREHISRTLDLYFEPADNGGGADIGDLAASLADAEQASDVQQAYRDGVIDTISWVLENPEIVSRLVDRRD